MNVYEFFQIFLSEQYIAVWECIMSNALPLYMTQLAGKEAIFNEYQVN